jgi:organic hydroperoxide reductase OsmC/OhrA
VPRTHAYHVRITWTGNRGGGTTGYRDYDREHEVTAGPPAQTPDNPRSSETRVVHGVDEADGTRRPRPIAGSSDPGFRGDPGRWNPEQLLTASLAQCHMLWYLHLCAVGGIVVTAYQDDALGVMSEEADGGGRFTEAVLRPRVTVSSPDMVARAIALHGPAHDKCFIANSVNFPVRHEPVVAAAAP